MSDSDQQQSEEVKEVINKKRKTQSEISIPFNSFLLNEDIDDQRKLIVVLEQAPLQTAFLYNRTVLLNSDEHKNYISQQLQMDYSQFRPDIVHHSLLSLFDSPLNKAGLMQVYVHTAQNVILEINPKTRIPRTYKRFAALMAQVLTKLRVRAMESSETLLKIIKNPITDHLPPEAIKVGTSTKAELVNLKNYLVQKQISNKPIVFVVGAVSKGNPGMEALYINECICISKYSLSAGYCLQKLTNALETVWNIK